MNDHDIGAPGKSESWQDMHKREAMQREVDGPIDRISGDDVVDGVLASTSLMVTVLVSAAIFTFSVWAALSILGKS
jgi:hypothetical protein